MLAGCRSVRFDLPAGLDLAVPAVSSSDEVELLDELDDELAECFFFFFLLFALPSVSPSSRSADRPSESLPELDEEEEDEDALLLRRQPL